MIRKSGLFLALIAAAAFAAFLAFYAFAPLRPAQLPPAGYVPIRDDDLASRYMPLFDCPEEFGPVIAVYYRAARDGAGLVRIAYHPVWARERNEAPGFKPFLSRSLYTGGLSLQRLMFGKGDIEAVGLVIDPEDGAILEASYETAVGYLPSDFSVKHAKVVEKGPFSLPLRFRVVSWNHLFSLETLGTGSQGSSSPAPVPSYFAEALWREYGMWKNPETRLRKDRAHYDWERAPTGE